MDPTKESNSLTSHPGCKREVCILSYSKPTGGLECVMDSIRTRWLNPSAVNYCIDPSSNKFVNILNKKYIELKKK